jgi:glycosyltransferase involved in cell wall biosynthesis
MKLLSIILPVYKVEAYIRDCLESIFRQGLCEEDFEVILVNDGTPDNSIKVVEDLICLHQNIVVLNQENQGASIARNLGLSKSQGEYVYFMDPDDMLVDNSLSVLLPRVLSTDTDILMADYSKFNEGEVFDHLLHIDQEYSDSIKNAERSFIEDLSPYECYIWLMLFKRSFLINNNIEFKPFWYEDTLFCQECFIKAKLVLRTHFKLYVYRMRPGSFTSSMNLKKMLDLNSCLSALLKLKEKEGLKYEVKERLQDNIFSSFSYGLWCIVHNDELYAQRKILISDLKEKIKPSSFIFTGSAKQIIVSCMFRYFPYLYLYIRHSC